MLRELYLIYKIMKSKKDLSLLEQKEILMEDINKFQDIKSHYINSPYRRGNKYKYDVNDKLINIIFTSIGCLNHPEVFERILVKYNINKHRSN